MSNRLPKIAAIVGTASVAAIGAYAVGSQAGDGTASAAKGSSSASAARTADHDHGPFGLSSLADELGVSEAQLEQALEELRDARPGDDRHADLAAAVAKALGVDQAKVAAALEDLMPGEGRRGRWVDPVSALAKALGIEESKVEAAFEQLHEQREAEMEAQRAQFAKDLAAKLGISADTVAEALDDGPLGGPGHGRDGHRGPGGPGGPGFGRPGGPGFGHP